MTYHLFFTRTSNISCYFVRKYTGCYGALKLEINWCHLGKMIFPGSITIIVLDKINLQFRVLHTCQVPYKNLKTFLTEKHLGESFLLYCKQYAYE